MREELAEQVTAGVRGDELQTTVPVTTDASERFNAP
jgi:hypothetical protein